MKKPYIIFSAVIIAVCVLLIISLAAGVWEDIFHTQEEEQELTRVITLRDNGAAAAGTYSQIIWEENLQTYIRMEDHETVINVITIESRQGITEEQFAVWHSKGGIFMTWIGYDAESRRYARMMDAPVSATHPQTISLSVQDLIGDRSNCIIITGMNGLNEHTMTIYQHAPDSYDTPLRIIADLQINGSITIQETARSHAYQQGIALGQSFNIAAYGHDPLSSNILDQLETIYAYDRNTEEYGIINTARIPGSQVEQRLLRQILSGTPGVFENFISDLWYFVSPQGTIDTMQYIYFNPQGREIIFFGDETQQVFTWQNSTPTRFGLYIRSQNISIPTLRRFIDIELESLDSIKVRVTEDVRLKIMVSAAWDGTYRRAVNTAASGVEEEPYQFFTEAAYDSAWGRVQFFPTGEFTINSGGPLISGPLISGRYLFFNFEGRNLLEMNRRQDAEESEPPEMRRMEMRTVYRIESSENERLILTPVSLTSTGIRDLMALPITLTPAAGTP